MALKLLFVFAREQLLLPSLTHVTPTGDPSVPTRQLCSVSPALPKHDEGALSTNEPQGVPSNAIIARTTMDCATLDVTRAYFSSLDNNLTHERRCLDAPRTNGQTNCEFIERYQGRPYFNTM